MWDERDLVDVDEATTGPVSLSVEDLETLAAKPDSQWAGLWTELLELRRDRDSRAEHERLLAEAEAMAEEKTLDLSDPAIVAALRAEGQQRRDAADRRLRSTIMERNTAMHGAKAAAQMADNVSQEMRWFDRSDPIFESPTYQAIEQKAFEKQRESEAAFTGQRDFGLADAEAYVESVRARARERADRS